MYRILYLSPGPTPQNSRPEENVFSYLSQHFSGDLIATVWWEKNAASQKAIEKISLAMGKFEYHPIFYKKLPKLISIFRKFFYYIKIGLEIHSKRRYDIIVTYGVFTTGLAGYLLKKVTRAKLIIMVTIKLKGSYLFDSVKPSHSEKLKQGVGDILARFILNRADRIYSLAPNLLSGYRINGKIPVSIFPNFVPINTIKPSSESHKYILLIGYPWYRKGVDLLIKAFKIISNEFPDYYLKIVGFCPDKSYFQKLSEGNDKIELRGPAPHDEAMQLMSKCGIFALPSRNEGMGRVLLEAMAAKKPIVASNIDGISHCIKDGFNGLLFESENVEDLADKLRTVIRDPDYASKLAENGYRYVHEHLSEERFVEHYKMMVEKTILS